MPRKRKKRRPANPKYPIGDKKRIWANNHKRGGCRKCGEARLHVIDLHHYRGKKKFGISRGIRLAVTKKQFMDELAKTMPLCRCCHGDFHYQNSRTSITIEEYLKDGNQRNTPS